MPDLFAGALPIPLVVQLREVEREVALRRRVYPRWITEGRLTREAATRQVETMEAVAATLRRLLPP